MAETFVDIVGYQLEKIHTGMIAWLLDSERSPLPLVEQTEVIAELAPDFLPGMNVTEVKSTREYSFGRRLRIDLVLELSLEDQTRTYLLIECKTDSDVSVDQLTRSAEAFSEQNPDVPFSVIVLAVGAGQFTLTHQLQDIQQQEFHAIAIDLPRALEIFSGLSIAGTSRTYDDWIASLQSVMNWQEGWIMVGTGSDAIELYWEFNWNAFCLKAAIEEQTAARWDRWQEIRPALIELCESCPVDGRKTANNSGKWVTAYKWEFDFCQDTLSVIASKTNNILSHIHKDLFQSH